MQPNRSDGAADSVRPHSSPTTNAPSAAAKQSDDPFYVKPPAISLPKGGGALRGMGEKFAANPVTGTGALTIPIATSPGRAGFGPQLSLNYDSGAGNSPFGLGWNISLPAITRKTDQGLPQYRDQGDVDSDVFMLSGAEDLVPVLVDDGARFSDLVSAPGHVIHRYRPRIEGLFARIERWTSTSDANDVHWRVISKDNVLSVYGNSPDSRIVDPADASRIFSWLIAETRDDKGHAVLYRYKAEDGTGVNLGMASERHRGDASDERRCANRYIKHIHYGNRQPLLDAAGQRLRFLDQADMATQISQAGWMFEVVFDYGEHDATAPQPSDPGEWHCRPDPFSTYRAGFEVRVTRRCQRVLMFHHFPGEDGVGRDGLVRSTDFGYADEQEAPGGSTPIYSFLHTVTPTAYRRHSDGYIARRQPAVEFDYTQATISDAVNEVDASSLDNLPIGLDGRAYQWVDLHGEGLPGVLAEQAGTWFYKRNISPLGPRLVQFAPLERIALKPNLALAGGSAQFMDLAGNGQTDLGVLDGPMPGGCEHDEAEGWQAFRPLQSRLTRDLRDPNLRFIDLDGDGRADVLITEDDAFVWHASLAKEGFGPAQRVAQALDDDQGPRLVFADGTQSIHLADMSGDGLTDLVRIRHGNVCYWPNLGHGRFGAKVTMDHAPWLDNPDHFDHQRIRLVDVDGSGTADLIYLHRDGARLYFNHSGNGWSAATPLRAFPPVDDLASVAAIDLMGNGTACLVWSSPWPGDERRQMRYVDLMGGQKPHLLVECRHQLGAVTRVQYAPSTKFYLQDKRNGTPWVTKLPFPVHVVERVEVTDPWRGTAFTSTCSYHHGHFDGVEREFRGFARVEQVDIEHHGQFAKRNSGSPCVSADQSLYQPPVKTITWYHTGAFVDRQRIFSQLEHEYFPRSFDGLLPDDEHALPEPDLFAQDLTAEEWREALRACKGMVLRQEIYELDADALERGEQRPVKLFSAASRNGHLRMLQPRASNRHAVFLVAESEVITYHYELDLTEGGGTPAAARPDPRVAHTLNLRHDEYANVLQSVAVVYPRRGRFEEDSALSQGLDEALPIIHEVQARAHLVYTETRYTEDFGDRLETDNHRLRVPCEVLTYELAGLTSASGQGYFSVDELRGHQLESRAVPELAYHPTPRQKTAEKRLVEHVRMLFFKDDAAELDTPLALGQMGRLGLIYESYKLALTTDLLNAVFTDEASNKLDATRWPSGTARALIDDATVSGYMSGAALAARFPGLDTTGQYWLRSGVAGFAPEAAQHFYLPQRYTDAFENVTTLQYDPLDLYVRSSTDPMGNCREVTCFDYRVLAPSETKDINDNLTAVLFDTLGRPTAMAVKGKGDEGDHLHDFDDALLDPEASTLRRFFVDNDYDASEAVRLLGGATARYLYYFGDDGQHPACACSILRERHVSQLTPGEHSPVQAAFAYSDGLGSVVVNKVQAEPQASGQPLRWIASGKTIVNNKGKPVKQYEPYFSAPEVGHRFEEPQEAGVTLVIHYDAVGRTVRTDFPDGTYSRTEFSPWHARAHDQSDTVLGSDWYAARNPPDPAQALPVNLVTGKWQVTHEQRAAWLAAQHADTPSLTVFDSLGRDVIAVAHNRIKDANGTSHDERYITFTKLDAEGQPLWIRDARGNLVMQCIRPATSAPSAWSNTAEPVDWVPAYDLAGHLLFQHSMDAGDRWMLSDAAGQPFVTWDNRGHAFLTEYDALRRPVASFVKGAHPKASNGGVLFDKRVYGDDANNGLPAAMTTALNLRGQLYQHFDSAGLVVNTAPHPTTGTAEAFDFKGNLLRSTRKLATDYQSRPNWSANAPTPQLEAETFVASTRYDALNRPIQIVPPYSDRAASNVPLALNVIRPGYNQTNLLKRMDVWLALPEEPVDLLDRQVVPPSGHGVKHMDYNAKGQRTRIEHGNGAITSHEYDPNTFRLRRLRTTRDSSKCVLQNLSYVHDPVGNITHVQDDAQQAIYFSNQCVEPSNDYTYDALYRLIEASGREHLGRAGGPPIPNSHDDGAHIRLGHPGDGHLMGRYVESHQYDSVGNLLVMAHRSTNAKAGGWKRCYQYAMDSNRLLATSQPGVGPHEACLAQDRYEHDDHGNMVRMPHLGGGSPAPNLQWDEQDRLCRASLSGGGTAYFVHAASGERVRKVWEKAPGLTEERLYLGGFEIFRRHRGAIGANTAVLERETLHMADDQQRLALVETRTLDQAGDDLAPRCLVRYQLGNHLGSASLELDDQAQIISYEEHTPYGSTSYQAVRSQTETAKRYRFTGKERDEETGLSYHGARYYATWLGRWTSADPIGLVAGVNNYVYCYCSPIAFSDRQGMQPQEPAKLPSGNYEFADSVANDLRATARTGAEQDLQESVESGYYSWPSLYAAQQFERDELVEFSQEGLRPEAFADEGLTSPVEFSHFEALSSSPQLGAESSGGVLTNQSDHFFGHHLGNYQNDPSVFGTADWQVDPEAERLLGEGTGLRIASDEEDLGMTGGESGSADADAAIGMGFGVVAGVAVNKAIDLLVPEDYQAATRAAAAVVVPVVATSVKQLGLRGTAVAARVAATQLGDAAAAVATKAIAAMPGAAAFAAMAGGVSLFGIEAYQAAQGKKGPIEVADEYYGSHLSDLAKVPAQVAQLWRNLIH